MALTHGADTALERLRRESGVSLITRTPNTASLGYHETITRAYVMVLSNSPRRLCEWPCLLSEWLDFWRRCRTGLPVALSKERLTSDAACEWWLLIYSPSRGFGANASTGVAWANGS